LNTLTDRKTGLVVQSAPGPGLQSRDQLDIALSAASLGMELELFFTPLGITHLVPGCGGHKGWKALPELTSVKAWATAETLQSAGSPKEFLIKVNVATADEIAIRLAACDLAMVI